MATDYADRPLVLPLSDAVDEFDSQPLAASRYLEFAERFRRQAKKVWWAFIGPRAWGRAGVPIRLQLADATPANLIYWYRDAEPIDLSAYAQIAANDLPHPYWKWRITVEPAGLAGSLYDIANPAGGGGASVMAEDLVTKEGALTNLPVPFSAPSPAYNRVGNLQVATTADGGTTLTWANPVWN